MMKKMKYDFSQITTRGGDHGESTLFNGERRRKDDSLFFLLGDIDELSSTMGVAIAGVKCFSDLPENDPRIIRWLKVMDEIQGTDPSR
jgi:cob(I)alamin adenosyltransferase